MLADILFSMVGPLLSLYIPRAVSSSFNVSSFVHNLALWSLSQAWPTLETVHMEFVAMQRTSRMLCAPFRKEWIVLRGELIQRFPSMSAARCRCGGCRYGRGSQQFIHLDGRPSRIAHRLRSF